MHLALKKDEAKKKKKKKNKGGGGKSEKVKYLLKYEVKYIAQCSCLENLMDRGAWWAIVHGVAKSRTRLSY